MSQATLSPLILVDGDSLYEVVDGRRVELPPMAADAAMIAGTLDQLLGGFARSNGLGRVMPEMLFLLRPDRPQRRPDVAFVSYGRWARERPVPSDNAWEVVPDLAVEVVSPTNSAEGIVGKVREYFEAGVRRVWVVYPSGRLVYVYESPVQIRVFGPDDSLDGEDILPGLRLRVADLFEDVAGPTA